MREDLERQTLEAEDGESMVAVFSSANHDAEMEASAIQGVLESNGIDSILVGPHVLPSLGFQVQVSAHVLPQAQQLIREARKGGRRSADEAEAATE